MKTENVWFQCAGIAGKIASFSFSPFRELIQSYEKNGKWEEKWEVICVPGKLNFLPKQALICEIHFAANQISSSGGRKKTRSLVRKAIPSLFLPSKEMQMNASLGCKEEKSTDKDSS